MSSKHVLLIVVMIVGAAIFYGCEAGTAAPEDPKAAEAAATKPAARTSPAPSRSEEADILDYAAKHPLSTRVRRADGTWRRLKYGDIALDGAEKALKDYAKPWTVKKVLAWYKEAKDGKTRGHLLRVLAASRHPKAAIELGRALDDKSLDVRVAATYALLDYFAPDAGLNGGTESAMFAAAKWWRENRHRLLLEVATQPATQTATQPATQPAGQRKFEDALIFVSNYLSGVTNGATGTLSSQGWIECGPPGAVSKVSWQYLRTVGPGDVYLMTMAYPLDLPRDTPARRQVTYAGVPLVVFEGNNQRVVLLMRRLRNVHRDGLKADDALALLKEGRSRELSFIMDLLATPAAVPALVAVVRDEEGSAPMRAAALLGRIGSRDARDALITALRKTPQPDYDSGSSMRDCLVSAIDRCIEREPEKQVIDDLGHGHPEVRWLAAMQLGRRKSAAAVPALIALLDDKHPVRLGATWALGEIGDVRGDAVLFAIVEGRRGDGSVGSAVEAMGKIGTDRALAAVKSIKPGHPAHWMARKVLAGWGSNFRKPTTRPATRPATQRQR